MAPNEAEKRVKKSLILQLFLALAEDSRRETERLGHYIGEEMIRAKRKNAEVKEPGESDLENNRNAG